MTDLDLAELLCARLCHDLVNPVGAISMGLELVGTGPGSSAEDIALIDDSTKAAKAKLVFYRIAFGKPESRDRLIGLGEIGTIAHDFFSDPRLALSLPRSGPDLPPVVAKLSLLMLMVGASAAPYGGQMVFATTMVAPLALTLEVQGDRVALPPAGLALVQSRPGAFPEAPREAHLALLPRVAAAHGAGVRAEPDQGRLTLRVAAV
jgi:histidine phosphotransferase ChpT